MLNILVNDKHSENGSNNFYCLFNQIVLTPTIFNDQTHFLQITNIKDGYFKLQISEKSISKLQCIDLEGAVWECVSITNQNNIIIRIKSKGIVEEYVVESMKIFSKYDRRINCFSSRAGIQIRYLQTDNSVKKDYDKSFFSDNVEIIDINQDVEQIIVLPYSDPRCLSFNFKEYGININTIGSRPSFDPYKPEGYGLTTPIYELPIEIDWKNLYVGIEINKCIFSETYESISHASMDPGPETHYISTNWHLKALVAFSTKSDLNKFLSRYPKRECTFMDSYFLTPFSKENQRLVFTFETKPKNKTILEKELNITFYEYWQ